MLSTCRFVWLDEALSSLIWSQNWPCFEKIGLKTSSGPIHPELFLILWENHSYHRIYFWFFNSLSVRLRLLVFLWVGCDYVLGLDFQNIKMFRNCEYVLELVMWDLQLSFWVILSIITQLKCTSECFLNLLCCLLSTTDTLQLLENHHFMNNRPLTTNHLKTKILHTLPIEGCGSVTRYQLLVAIIPCPKS